MVEQYMQNLQQAEESKMVDVPMNDEGTDQEMAVDFASSSPVAQPMEFMNQILMQDNINEKIIQQDQENQSPNSQFAEIEQIQPEFDKNSKQLELQEVMNIFDSIDVFQIGMIKPEKTGDSVFSPIFPFFYKMLDHGDRILESRSSISLFLSPERK